jgi:hypothetical protein
VRSSLGRLAFHPSLHDLASQPYVQDSQPLVEVGEAKHPFLEDRLAILSALCGTDQHHLKSQEDPAMHDNHDIMTQQPVKHSSDCLACSQWNDDILLILYLSSSHQIESSADPTNEHCHIANKSLNGENGSPSIISLAAMKYQWNGLDWIGMRCDAMRCDAMRWDTD